MFNQYLIASFGHIDRYPNRWRRFILLLDHGGIPPKVHITSSLWKFCVPLWSTLKADCSFVIEVITIGFHMYYGSEFKAGVLQEWLCTVNVESIYIYPDSLWEFGYDERFNGTLRHEVLDNYIRPHQSLGQRPPVPETISPTLSLDLVHI